MGCPLARGLGVQRLVHHVAFALKWRHVDFERGMVQVRGTLTRVRKRKDGGKGWKITKPKTASSCGDVPLSSVIM